MRTHIMKISPIVLLLGCSLFAHAQTGGKEGNVGNEDINIVKDYQPVLNDAFKINISPDQDTISFRSPAALTYKADPKPMNAAFNTRPIKPVRIKDDVIKKLYHGWIKAGYGLENMPLLDISYNALRSKNFDAGVRFNHLSASGKIKDYGQPASSLNKLNVFGTRYFEKFSLGAALGYRRDLVHYYGYKSPPDLYSKSETRRAMDDINGNVSLASINKSKDEWTYSAGLDFYNFRDNRKNNENNVRLEARGSKLMNNAVFSMTASFEGGKISEDLFEYNRSIFRLKPTFTFSKDQILLTAGGNLAYEVNNGSGAMRIYPVARAEYQVINDAFKILAEASGDLERNDLRALSRENPFLDKTIALTNTNRKLTVMGGLSVKLEHDLMFIGEVSYGRYRNMPFFINYYDSLFPVTYTTYYDNVNLLRIKGALEYKQGEKVSAAVSAEYNKYDTDHLSEAIYKPAFRFGLNGHYNISDKIYLKADVTYNSDMTGIQYTATDSTVSSTKINLKGWLDFSLGIDYRYSKVLSVWVQLNNVAFAQYYRWYEYPSYRFLGLAGFTYSF